MSEDLRARRCRHRRLGGIVGAAVAIIVGGMGMAGIASGGAGAKSGGNVVRQPAGSGAGGGVARVSVGSSFPGAPATQPNGYGVESDVCPLARPNRYLPARAGCVTVKRADVDGDGKPDLILLYSRLSRRHPSSFAGMPRGWRREFLAKAAFLKVVLAGGASVSTRIKGSWAAKVDAIAHVSDEPGREIFLETERISSGATGVAYGFHDGRPRSCWSDARPWRRLRDPGRLQLLAR